MREKYGKFFGVRISEREFAMIENRGHELGGGLSVGFRAILAEWHRHFGLRGGSITSDDPVRASLPDTPKGGLDSQQASAPGCPRQASTALSRGMADSGAATGPGDLPGEEGAK